MSTYRNRLMMAALVAGACLWGPSAQALDLNDVGFHAGFQDGLKADIAKGKAEPVEIVGKPEIVEGRNGGRALKLRNGVDALGFELKGNLNPQAGALSLWLAPGANWGYDEKGNIKDGGSQVLFHTGGISTEPQRMVLQTYWRENYLGMITHDGENLVGGWADGIFQNVFGYPPKTEAKEGVGGACWNYLLFTWRDGRMDSYCNGVRMRRFENSGVTFRKMGDRFYLGWKKDPNPAVDLKDSLSMKKGLVFFDPGCLVSHGIDKGMDTAWETLISEVTLFDQFVNESQVEKIYEAGALEYAQVAGSNKTTSSVKFYASFDRDMTPDAATGSRGGTPVAFGQPTLTEGKFGKALRLVSRKSGVAYPLAGHLRADRGTLTFWATTENWDSGDGSLVGLFSTSGKKRIQLQTNPKARSALEFQWFEGEAIADEVTGYGRCGAPVICHQDLIAGIDRLMPKTWFHFTYAWGGGEVKAYRNGVLVSKEAFGKWTGRDTAQLGDSFALGFPPDWPVRYLTEPGDAKGKQESAPWRNFLDKDYVTIIDDLAILDRKLNEAEVGRLYRHGVKALMADEAAGIQLAELRVKPLPTQGRVVFEAIHGEAPDGARSLVRFTASDQAQPPRDLPLKIVGEQSRGETTTTELKPGAYKAEYRLEDKAGALLALGEEQIFEVAPHEDWWNNKIGLDDMVLPPWTPLSKKGDKIACWGREIDFAGQPLPAQIASKGTDPQFTAEHNLLASPITLDLSVDGKPLDFGRGKVDYPLASETAMERTWKGEKDGVSMTVRSRTEFDGFIWTTVTVDNPAGKPVTGLKLLIPVAQTNALFVHTHSRGWRGECPPDVNTRKEWKSPFGTFCNPVWLGGYERGLQWLAEGRGGWFNKDKSDEIRVSPEGDRVTLTVKMIDSPCDRKSFTVKFGFHPTPIKPPFLRSHRPKLHTYGVVPTVPGPSGKNTNITEQAYWAGNRQMRAADPDFYRYSFINSVASYYGDGEEIFTRKWYKSEWENLPGGERLDPLSWSWFSACAETSYTDWWVWFLKNRWVNPDYGNNAGIYFDHGSPIPCVNPLHDGKCGYLDENGVMQPELKILAMRRLLKRAYCAIKGIDKDSPFGTTPQYPIFENNGPNLIAPLLSFADNGDGETFRPAPNGHMMDRLTPDLMATEFSRTSWGFHENGVFMGPSTNTKGTPYESWWAGGLTGVWADWVYRGKKPEGFEGFIALLTPAEREYNAMMLLFDHSLGFSTASWKYYTNLENWRRAKGVFGFDEDDVEFRGFWKTGEIVKGQTEKFKASVYLRKTAGKALIVLVNMDEKPVKLSAALDLTRIGCDRGAALSNPETGEPISGVNGAEGQMTANITIPGRDYALVLAEQKFTGEKK